ncbi:hypothetical protein [Novosphingobium aquimarinum]|uniref:hypothetical protein n=1 Tax=Novosphingobium aquimarinum TaxID=2682494 RepID=UPI0012EC0D49|nr:hypothetical protein [Novosphingobium aquimarinum]
MTFQSDGLAHDQNEPIDNGCAFASNGGHVGGQTAPGYGAKAAGNKPRLGASGRLERKIVDTDRLSHAVGALSAIRGFCVEASNLRMPTLGHVNADDFASLLGIIIQEMRVASGDAPSAAELCGSN